MMRDHLPPALPQRAWCILVALLALPALAMAQASSPPTVIVTVSVDETRQPDAQIMIRPRGPVVDWPADKKEIVLTTDRHGRAAYALPPGSYQLTARGMGGRLPTGARITIPPGQTKPLRVYLQLRYWDCGVVTCIL
jgi:hypothetical protein